MAKQERKTVAKSGDVRCSERRQEFSSQQQKKKRMQRHGGEITFIVIQKNVTSLCSRDRVEELAREVCDCRWDALLISESWRPGKAELRMTLQGHIYMGAGRFPNKHGVRKLLNRR